MELAIADLNRQPRKLKIAGWLPDYDIGSLNWVNDKRMVFQTVVTGCEVGGGISMRLEVHRESPIADTHVHSLRQMGKSTPVFSDIDGVRGASVRVVCVGRKHRALVLSGEFTANAAQGCVLTFKPHTQKVGRLDFAGGVIRMNGARDRNRTGTPFLTRDFKSRVSTSFTTRAAGEILAQWHHVGRGS